MKAFRFFLCIVVIFYVPYSALAGGSMPWEWAHAEIAKDDPKLMAMINRLFEIHSVGGAMRPLHGKHAGERLPPYDFRAKPKGEAGDYSLIITFEPTGRDDKSWSARIERPQH